MTLHQDRLTAALGYLAILIDHLHGKRDDALEQFGCTTAQFDDVELGVNGRR